MVATHGRSFYVLDNISMLRQMEPDLTASTLHLFKPDAAIRSYRPATIDYFLAKDADSVKVTILDAAGHEVRTL